MDGESTGDGIPETLQMTDVGGRRLRGPLDRPYRVHAREGGRPGCAHDIPQSGGVLIRRDQPGVEQPTEVLRVEVQGEPRLTRVAGGLVEDDRIAGMRVRRDDGRGLAQIAPAVLRVWSALGS